MCGRILCYAAVNFANLALSHLELPSHLDIFLALGDPHHGGEDEHQRGSKYGASEAHHEPEVREQHADRGEKGQQHRRSDHALGLRGVLCSGRCGIQMW